MYYKIIDNGCIPFVVKIVNKTATIYETNYQMCWINDNVTIKEIMKDSEINRVYKINRVILGRNIERTYVNKKEKYKLIPKTYLGNSMLLELPSGKYIYIREVIYEFKPKEKITHYYSRMANSEVSYPVGFSDNYIYLFLEKVYLQHKIPRKDYVKWGFEGYIPWYRDMSKKEKKKFGNEIKHKLLEKS